MKPSYWEQTTEWREAYRSKAREYGSRPEVKARQKARYEAKKKTPEWIAQHEKERLAREARRAARVVAPLSPEAIEERNRKAVAYSLRPSWRANHVKNNGTPEEHRKVADFYGNYKAAP